MSMEADFRALLANDQAVIDLVAARITPSTYPQGTPSPAVRFMKTSGGPGLHMQGSDGLSIETVQVDVRAAAGSDPAGASSVALGVRDAIVAKLHAFSGLQGTTRFLLIQLRDDRGAQFDNTGPTAYYTASLDFDVTWRAA